MKLPGQWQNVSAGQTQQKDTTFDLEVKSGIFREKKS